MQFTLHYRGDLRASHAGRGGSRLDDKWRIRRQIHPQLKGLWEHHQVLNSIQSETVIPADGEHFFTFNVHHSQPEPESNIGPNTIDLTAPMTVAGKSFIPLIRDSMSLVCDLDILFLRKGEPGQLISQSGDIDNRIKTLLDGLRMPSNANEIGKRRVSRPTYCLLENDSLITGLNVQTDRLLDYKMTSEHAVQLIIKVTVNVIHVRPYNQRLMGH